MLNLFDALFQGVKLLCDFSRLSSIAKFVETGIHKHQYFDYQMTTHTSRNTMYGYPEAFTLPRKQPTT